MTARSTSAAALAFLTAAGLFLPVLAAAQQVPEQPGTKWTVEQLKAAVAPVRAGRKLTPKTWPNDARVAVCLSFDVDNESYLLAGGQTSPTTLSAADFGSRPRCVFRLFVLAGVGSSGRVEVGHPAAWSIRTVGL